MAENPLVSFGDLGKPVNTLIERVSDAVGGLTRPWQIRRVAGAEAEAAVIRAESEIRITELHKEAFLRFLDEEVVKQTNMESILLKAIPNVDPDNAKPEDVTGDWFANFFDKCRIVSDEDMQQLWARILAGEANNPGSFSRRTVNLMADLDKQDAEAFTHLCRFVWTSGEDWKSPLVFDWAHDIYFYHGRTLYFPRLEELGLALVAGDGLSWNSAVVQRRIRLDYHGLSVILARSDGGDVSLDPGRVVFTTAGRELYAAIHPLEPVEGDFEYAYDHWAGHSLLPPRS